MSASYALERAETFDLSGEYVVIADGRRVGAIRPVLDHGQRRWTSWRYDRVGVGLPVELPMLGRVTREAAARVVVAPAGDLLARWDARASHHDAFEVARFAHGAGEVTVLATADLPITVDGYDGPVVHGICDRRSADVLVLLDPSHAGEGHARWLLTHMSAGMNTLLWRANGAIWSVTR
ncbi:hypothetical protein [Candidatus Protofrankia californiensis]|uniref:hypothetical protein n=1 Tax=Candidatus Protofrankia californiensis TaxID=1839754 RepID=UPI00104103F3|nr:hypothetical protein [Candidatus Protofrankia californiensis]